MWLPQNVYTIRSHIQLAHTYKLSQIKLEQEQENIKWDIIRINEIKRKNQDLMELNLSNILYHQGTPTGRIRAVDFQSKERNTGIEEGTSISDRIALSFDYQRYIVKIVQVYAKH